MSVKQRLERLETAAAPTAVPGIICQWNYPDRASFETAVAATRAAYPDYQGIICIEYADSWRGRAPLYPPCPNDPKLA